MRVDWLLSSNMQFVCLKQIMINNLIITLLRKQVSRSSERLRFFFFFSFPKLGSKRCQKQIKFRFHWFPIFVSVCWKSYTTLLHNSLCEVKPWGTYRCGETLILTPVLSIKFNLSVEHCHCTAAETCTRACRPRSRRFLWGWVSFRVGGGGVETDDIKQELLSHL